jgi:hypothetical protein
VDGPDTRLFRPMERATGAGHSSARNKRDTGVDQASSGHGARLVDWVRPAVEVIGDLTEVVAAAAAGDVAALHPLAESRGGDPVALVAGPVDLVVQEQQGELGRHAGHRPALRSQRARPSG